MHAAQPAGDAPKVQERVAAALADAEAPQRPPAKSPRKRRCVICAVSPHAQPKSPARGCLSWGAHLALRLLPALRVSSGARGVSQCHQALVPPGACMGLQ